VFYVLDCLDRCDEYSLEMLSEKLRDFFSKSHSGLKLITVSREPLDCIPRAMSGFPNVRLDPDPGATGDLQRFIASKVYELPTQRSYSDNLHTSTESALQERTKETFLWVGFVIRELRVMAYILPPPWFIHPGRYIRFCGSNQVIKPEGRRVEVKDSLNRLPIGLKEMCGHMLLWIRKDMWDIAVLILCWMTMAVQPLTLTELGVATGIRLSRFTGGAYRHEGKSIVLMVVLLS
jgi:hypothetical protein